MRILLAEDEQSLARALIRILENNHYTVDAVYNGEEALSYLQNGHYDAVVLDIMMPKMDGITVLQKLRQQGDPVPVLILSAKGEVDDKVAGLDSGANDYLAKPFDTKELLARLRVLTRKQGQTDSRLSVGNLTLDRATYVLSSSAESFRLTNKEYQIMELLMSNPRQLVPSERLLERVWGYDSDTEMNVVWVYISYLRKKLTALHANVQIKALRNVGYMLEEMS